ncbi:hypothetical protein KI440_03570 [Candidatus Saccharibacteria bacterium TM7i]|nr:hypothetical protein KI440_03570 [Candidatus Saccharibacteria bacterium TM7i]
MFKKIVSRISFSPSLVAQLSFYAKRLRKEQATRRLGLIFVALALVVQSLVVFQAPEPANAAHTSNMIEGGLGWSSPDLGRYLRAYDSNSGYTRNATSYFGITRAELAAAKYGSFSIDSKVSWGWDYPMPTSRAVAITNDQGQKVRTLYGRYMKDNASNPPTVTGFIGHSSRIGWFAISTACGNITTVNFPEPPPPPPAPAKIVTTKTAVNTSQSNIDATKATAKENDLLTYTISAKNEGGTAKQVELVDKIGDVLRFATLTAANGGTLDSKKGTLSWPDVTIGPGQTVKRQYTVKMNSSLISPDSCSMTNTFTDKKVTVAVGCSTPPAQIVAKKEALNVSQGNIDATTTVARAKDTISFSLSAVNNGGTAKEVAFDDYIGDVLEYSTLVNTGGGQYNEKTKMLSWPKVLLKPGAKEVRTFTIEMLATIPASSKNVSETSSYNCKLENTFLGSDTVIDVDCPAPKVIVESTVTELPKTGAGANMAFAALVFATATFFYFRSRQLSTEVRLVRRNLHGNI